MIKAKWSKFVPEMNEWVFGLNEYDFGKIAAGYACGTCLEDYNGLYLEECPVCKTPREKNQKTVETPPEWR